MQSAVTREGSPTTKPCARSEMSGTANEQLATKNINTADYAGTSVHTRPLTTEPCFEDDVGGMAEVCCKCRQRRV